MTSTNGHFLKDRILEETVKSGLDRLIISIDGTTREVYQQYRKTVRSSFSSIWRGQGYREFRRKVKKGS